MSAIVSFVRCTMLAVLLTVLFSIVFIGCASAPALEELSDEMALLKQERRDTITHNDPWPMRLFIGGLVATNILSGTAAVERHAKYKRACRLNGDHKHGIT